MQWNAGGWFGGQIGATAWMFVAGVLTATKNLPAGMFVVLLFSISNIIGLILWYRRNLSCYKSTQLLLVISGICGLLTVYALEKANSWTQIQAGGSVSALSTYFIISSVVLGLMVMFHVRFGRYENKPKS